MSRFFGDVIRRRAFDGIEAVEKRHASGEHLPAHGHDRPYLTLVVHGRYDEHHGRERVVCAAPAVIIHPAGEVHANRFAYGTAHLVALEVQPGLAPELDAVCDRRREVSGPDVAGWVARLRHELRQSDEASALALRGCLWSLVAVLSRRAVVDAAPVWLSTARARIEQAPLAVCSPARLAHELGVPVGDLSRRYRAWYGTTPGAALRAARLEEARRRLEAGVPLADIAADCGFADQSHFTRAFAHAYGMPPGRYRAAAAPDEAGVVSPAARGARRDRS